MKNLLIIGGGKAAQMRAEINRTHGLFKIHGLVTRSPALSKILRDQSYQVFSSLGELGQSALDSIDGYWIAQADQDHFDTLKQVIPHRKPIYIEKPLTDSLQKTVQIIQMSKEFNTPIHLGYQRRHCPSLAAVYSDIQKTGFNHLQFTERDLPWSPPESLTSSGCIITNFGCHAVNLFLWYTNGALPHRVQANGGQYYGTGVVDRVDFTLWFFGKNAQNVLVEKSASFSLSRQSTTGVYENLVEVITGDTLKTYGQDLSKPQNWAERYRTAFTEEMRVFKEVLESRKPGQVVPKTPLEDEVAAFKIMEALVKSYYTQRTVFLDKNGGVGEDNATRPIGLGFLGCGDFGNFQKDKILGGDPKFELKEVWLGRRSGPEAKSNLVNNPEIEAVYVCTPCAHHSINSIEAMRGGKHVHVEKPLYGLKETILQSQASMKILYIGYHRRQSDTWLAMRASLQARCLTNISPAKLIFTAIDPCSPDQDTETSLEDLKTVIGQTLVHEIDVLTWTYPDSNFEVTSVSPQPNSGSCLKGIITHPNGMKTEIELINTKTGADAKRYLNRCMVHSTDGSIEKFEVEYFANTEHMCYVYKEAYQKCWAEFYSLVRGDSYDVESRLDSYLKTDRVLGAFHLAAEEFFKK